MDRAERDRPLRRGWTTGTCAAAATRAAYQALLTGVFPDPVEVLLPGGVRPSFALAMTEIATTEMADAKVASAKVMGTAIAGAGQRDWARAGVVKDAGDDPDVTHGALIVSTVRLAPAGHGISFRAGEGVGTVTLPGLPLPPGEPAINPVPREIISTAITEAAALYGGAGDAIVELSIPGGEKIAERTLNARLGIIGGLSILGTTGIVVPYSCSAWIHSIYRGIDVARAAGIQHVAGATGSTSEAAIARLHGLPDQALIDMGDFVGGMLKYLRRHPVRRVTVAGGMAKMSKLGQGLLDLHSRRGEVDPGWLAERAIEAGGGAELASRIGQSNTAMEAFGHARDAGIDLAAVVAQAAWRTAATALDAGILLEIVIFNRSGQWLAGTGFRSVH
jgi:cobalt-precorrin-5B (C1)-methyltransferase